MSASYADGATVFFEGSGPMIVRRQGWRADAPPPSAAKGLDPGRSSAPERNQGVGALRRRELGDGVLLRVPHLAAGNHGVENDDHLPHAGDEGDLGLLSPVPEALVVGFEHRISARRGADDGQVQQVAQLAPAALDEASSLMLAAAVLVGRQADQRRGLLVGDQTELGQEGDQAGDTDLAQVGHAADEACQLGEPRVGLDPLLDCRLESRHLLLHVLLDLAITPANLVRLVILAQVGQAGLQIHEVGARADQPVELLARSIGLPADAVGKRLAEPGDHAGVDPVGLGQLAGRLSEATHPLGIDDPHLEPVILQQPRPAPLVAPAGLHHRLVHLVLRDPLHQLAAARRRVRERRFRPRAQRDVTLSLATSMPTIVLFCAILRLPSLRVRAPGPCNCSGLGKTPDLSLAPSQAMP